MDLVCIVCPNSCKLTIENGTVTGATCNRGVQFAKDEVTNPMRTVCTTVATVFEECPVLPVRTDKEIPKNRMFDLIALTKGFKLDHKVKRGDVVMEKVLGTDANLIATGSID